MELRLSLFALTAALACAPVIAAPPQPVGALKFANPTWNPPARKNTPEFMRCDEKAHGIWNRGVCMEARQTLTDGRVPITFASLSRAMDVIDARAQRAFDDLVEKERLRRAQNSV